MLDIAGGILLAGLAFIVIICVLSFICELGADEKREQHEKMMARRRAWEARGKP